jgi:hypothetical protein
MDEKNICCPSGQKFILTLTLIVGVTLVLALALFTNRNDNDPNYTITVSAEGEAVAKPDVAVIVVGVKTPEKMKIEQVMSENTTAVNKILQAIKAAGIDDKDIKTTSYNLYPVYDYLESRGQVLKGYTLDQQIQIKIRKMDTVGDIIELATRNGANQVGSVSFTIDDPEELKNEARQEAIAKAKDKAKDMARTSGINLGKLVGIYENFNSQSYPVYSDVSMKSVSGMGGMAIESPEIAIGEDEINVTVSLTYEVK